MLATAPRLAVGSEEFAPALIGLDARTVVHEMNDRDALGQLGHAADVVEMIVSDHQVVDSFHASRLRGRRDAVCIPAAETGPTGIDKQRLAAGRDHQGSLPAFYVDEVNVEGAAHGAAEGRASLP